MPYREPIFFAGGYYHIYSRGSEKRTIFLDRADKKRFLTRLREYKDFHNVSIICYCLMPNHYHFLVEQNTDEPISKFLNRLNLAYAMYFNKRYERVGPLFQGRFKAKNIKTDEYLLHLSRYIHLNPLELVGQGKVDNYLWSSLRGYIFSYEEDFVDYGFIKAFFGKDWKGRYKSFLEGEVEKRIKEKMEELLFESTPVQVRVLSTRKHE